MGGFLSKILGLFTSDDRIDHAKDYERVNLLDENNDYEKRSFFKKNIKII